MAPSDINLMEVQQSSTLRTVVPLFPQQRQLGHVLVGHPVRPRASAPLTGGVETTSLSFFLAENRTLSRSLFRRDERGLLKNELQSRDKMWQRPEVGLSQQQKKTDHEYKLIGVLILIYCVPALILSWTYVDSPKRRVQK